MLNQEKWNVIKKSYPFPHAHIKEFLAPEIYQFLENEFPPVDLFKISGDITKNNSILKVSYNKLPEAGLASWNEISQYFVSKDHFYYMCDFYHEEIKSSYPHLAERIKNKDLNIGVAGIDSEDEYDVLLDFQIGINTPVKEKSRCRGPHLDNRKVFFVGLCYFRHDDDKSGGGEYAAYKVKKGRVRLARTGRAVDLDQLEIETIVPYSKNNLATFMNTPLSVHGVSEREITSFPRRFFVFNAVMTEELYEIKTPFWDKIKWKIFG